MLHTKFRENRPAGSGEEDFWRVYTIYGPGGHLGHVTQMPRTNFHSPYPRRLHIKFDIDQASGFGEEDVWNCLRRTDGRRRTPDHEYPISSPMSLWLRWAKKFILILVTFSENKMHYVCLVYVFGNLFFQFCDFDSILHLLCVEILIGNLKFFLRKI